ncbi:MAG: hypothetical protein Q8P52_00275 [bacterium]|nr:hypothetical protein [bacterium]
MSERKLIFWIFLTSLSVATAHVLALEFFLYWRYFWLDIPMHFFGGLLIGFVFVLFGKKFLSYDDLRDKEGGDKMFKLVIFGTAFVGVVWEIFEYSIGIIEYRFVSYSFDTVKDLFLDLLGGLSAFSIWQRVRGVDASKLFSEETNTYEK